jgi:hypothetical protein
MTLEIGPNFFVQVFYVILQVNIDFNAIVLYLGLNIPM